MTSVSGLPGWGEDDHGAALAAYRVTADLLGPDWPQPVGEAPRAFFEFRFEPRLVSETALLTGYYEPELDGSDRASGPFHFPLYGPPDDLPPGARGASRAEIEDGNLLAGRELVWLNNALEAFLVQVQGSVRVRLSDGRIRRFGFAGKNGQPYVSIGKELVRRGEVAAGVIDVDAIRAWAARNPDRLPDLLRANPSFVFFRQLDLPEDAGPLGTLQRPVSAMRTVAVDPAHIPLGAPVWVEWEGGATLAIAQDTGGAIKGLERADLFFGSGPVAGALAGRLKAPARLTVLVPRGAA